MMDFSKNDLSKVRAGDEIFVLLDGTVTVTETNDDSFRAGNLRYRKEDGSLCNCAHFPVAFWSEPEIIIPAPPKRKVKRETGFWVLFRKDGQAMSCANDGSANANEWIEQGRLIKHYTDTIEIEE
jgi:hypothetical protein